VANSNLYYTTFLNSRQVEQIVVVGACPELVKGLWRILRAEALTTSLPACSACTDRIRSARFGAFRLMEVIGKEDGNILIAIVMIIEAAEDEPMFAKEANSRVVLGLRLQHHGS
jgi:hypothetical protein